MIIIMQKIAKRFYIRRITAAAYLYVHLVVCHVAAVPAADVAADVVLCWATLML